jgi:hypothetical protein
LSVDFRKKTGAAFRSVADEKISANHCGIGSFTKPSKILSIANFLDRVCVFHWDALDLKLVPRTNNFSLPIQSKLLPRTNNFKIHGPGNGGRVV